MRLFGNTARTVPYSDSSSEYSDAGDSVASVASVVAYSDSQRSARTERHTCCNRGFINVQALGDHLRDAFVHRTSRVAATTSTPAPVRRVIRPVTTTNITVATIATPARKTVTRKAKKDYDCDHCPRAFTTFPGLEQHRIAVHPDEKNHCCPFCKSKHCSKSAVAMHLESGECRSKVTREILDQHVYKSTKGKLGITSAIIRNDNPPLPPLPKFHATEDVKNTKGKYPCHFCPGIAFPRLQQLQQHLNTPKHARRIPDLYACPKCGFDGQTFSGLQQHVKMARCGARKDADVRAALDEMTDCLKDLKV